MRFRFPAAGQWLAIALAGVLCALFSGTSVTCRNLLGKLSGQGSLLAISGSEGLYAADVERALRQPWVDAVEQKERARQTVFHQLAADLVLKGASRAEVIAQSAIDREYDSLAGQVRPEAAWQAMLRGQRLFSWQLRSRLANELRAREWIEREIAGRISVTDDECCQYYSAHLQNFVQPSRLRVSHIFLAAPAGTSADVVETKRQAINAVAERLSHGEKFSDLAAAISEDEATRQRGGDLGFFSEERMPPDFFAAVRSMHAGETSPVVPTRLGFHVIQVTAVSPSRQMTFEEAREETRLALANQRRSVAVSELREKTAKQAVLLASNALK